MPLRTGCAASDGEVQWIFFVCAPIRTLNSSQIVSGQRRVGQFNWEKRKKKIEEIHWR